MIRRQRSVLEDRKELTVQVGEEYARKVCRKTKDRARQQSLKRYETCSPRGTSQPHIYTPNETRDHGGRNALYRPRRMFVKR